MRNPRPLSAAAHPDRVVWMPTDPPVPAPEVLTVSDVVTFLRLDRGTTKHPERTVGYYRRRGLLRGIKLGNDVRFPLGEVLAFVANKVQEEPR